MAWQTLITTTNMTLNDTTKDTERLVTNIQTIQILLLWIVLNDTLRSQTERIKEVFAEYFFLQLAFFFQPCVLINKYDHMHNFTIML